MSHVLTSGDPNISLLAKYCRGRSLRVSTTYIICYASLHDSTKRHSDFASSTPKIPTNSPTAPRLPFHLTPSTSVSNVSANLKAWEHWGRCQIPHSTCSEEGGVLYVCACNFTVPWTREVCRHTSFKYARITSRSPPQTPSPLLERYPDPYFHGPSKSSSPFSASQSVCSV